VSKRAIFHLSFPVSSLAASVAFYEGCLGAVRGRDGGAWCDLVLFGHQLTLHEKPEQVQPREARGVRHFGAVLDWGALDALLQRLQSHRPATTWNFALRDAGTPEEHAKLLLDDPDGNLIELKAYRARDPVAIAQGQPAQP
jgi:extradiol dioxygenase family protein